MPLQDPNIRLLHAVPYAKHRQEQREEVGRLRAPDDLSNVVNAVGQFSQLLAATQAGCYVTEA